jgi:acetyl esterase/lipase
MDIEIRLWPDSPMQQIAGRIPDQLLPPRGDGVDRITNVSNPSLTLHRATEPGVRPAIIICPGGAYRHLCISKEGTDVAMWLSRLGIHALVLKYRVPDDRLSAFRDIQRSLRIIRHRSSDLSIDPHRVGVLGFSAGGHLCARLCCSIDTREQAVDDIDTHPCRPDNAILVYPAYLQQDSRLSPDLSMHAGIPPTLLIHSDDDTGHILGSETYHTALIRTGITCAFERYTSGGHGYGLRSSAEARQWPRRAKSWLQSSKFL